MARASSITDEQILGAAREVFLHEGLRATTAEIAAAAGISEGSVFRRFPSKETLFHRSMQLERPAWFDDAPELEANADSQWAMKGLANRLIDLMSEMLPVLHAVMSCGPGSHRTLSHDSPFVQSLEVLTDFFERQISAHHIAAGEPELIARIFAGACHHFAFSQLTGVNALETVSRVEFVEELVARISGEAG